ncbi:MAG: hypothetical protein V3S43_06325 [Acidimicrobiia bacterium]
MPQYGQGILAHPALHRRKQFSGPIVGGLCCVAGGHFGLTIAARGVCTFQFPFPVRLAGVGWFTEQTAISAATLSIEINNVVGGSSATDLAFNASDAGISIDIVADPSGTAWVHDDVLNPGAGGDLDAGETYYLGRTNAHQAQVNLDSREIDQGLFIRLGVDLLTGTSLLLSTFFYYWPTNHAYADEAND